MGFLSVIRRWVLLDKMPIREISRRTGLPRNTIRKNLRADIVEPSFQTPTRPRKLVLFAENLSGWLLMEQRKSRKERRTAKQMHADLVQLGFDGSYERVAVFVRAWEADRQRVHQTTDVLVNKHPCRGAKPIGKVGNFNFSKGHDGSVFIGGTIVRRYLG